MDAPSFPGGLTDRAGRPGTAVVRPRPARVAGAALSRISSRAAVAHDRRQRIRVGWRGRPRKAVVEVLVADRPGCGGEPAVVCPGINRLDGMPPVWYKPPPGPPSAGPASGGTRWRSR